MSEPKDKYGKCSECGNTLDLTHYCDRCGRYDMGGR